MLHYSSFEEIASRDLEMKGTESVYNRKQFIKLIETGGEVKGLESAWFSSDGTIVYVRENARAVRDSNGKTLYYEGMVEDITERKLAQEAALESEERFRKLFEEHSAVKLLIDFITGKIVDANSATTKYYGWDKEELLKMNINEINTLPAQEFQKAMDKAKNKTKTHFEFQHRLKNGIIRYVDVFSSKVIIGNKEYLHSIVHDITDRKFAEIELEVYRDKLEDLVKERTKELNHANEELQQMIEKEKEIEVLLQKSLEKEKVLNEMKSNFISMASHEFRTPLTTILSSTDLLAKYYKRWEENKIISHYKKIQSSVHYMIAMLDEVLIISRSDRGKIDFNPSELNLKEFSADIIEQLKSQALPAHNIIFDYKLSYQNVLADPKVLNHIKQLINKRS